MNKVVFVALVIAMATGCAPKKEVVDIINGAPGAPGVDGSSCSVSDYSIGEEVLGALINCTDGSSAIILNGANGADGVDGENGIDGIDGIDAKSCTIKRRPYRNYVVVKCGGHSVRIYDDVFIGGQIQSNDSALINIGLDF